MRIRPGLRTTLAVALVTAVSFCGTAWGQEGAVRDQSSSHVKLRNVSPKDVRWRDGFWGQRFEQCYRVVVPNLWRVMQLPNNAATFNDLRMAAGLVPKGKPGGTKWSDGDCHKLIEAMAYLYEVTGDAKYADVMERVLYNSMLSAIGLDGTDFFYTNPLHRCGAEVPLLSNDLAARWPDTMPESPVHCFCCPPNVARTIAKLHGWAYSVSDDAVWVNLYGSSILETRLPDGSPVKLMQKTDYPWHGRITIQIEQAPAEPMALMLRIPGWAAGSITATIRRPPIGFA